jgi:hypothetical protein
MRLDRVQVSVNAGSAALDLGSAVEIQAFEASVNAGSLAVTLPPVSMTGDLSANAGSLELCVPDGEDVYHYVGLCPACSEPMPGAPLCEYP